MSKSSNTSYVTLALSDPTLASTVPHLHHQYIEKERVLLFADELIVQPVLPMTNPGSLAMGLSGVDPRQLAPSVGTTQVGNAISTVSSSPALTGLATVIGSNPFEP